VVPQICKDPPRVTEPGPGRKRVRARPGAAIGCFIGGMSCAIDRALGEIEPGDAFLLCSDGLHSCVPEAEIGQLLGRGSPERALDALLAATLGNGAPDNVTAIAIRIG